MSDAATAGSVEVTVRDQSIPRSDVSEMLLRFSSAHLSARDLIAERVRTECDRRMFDSHGRETMPLVQPSEEEALLNGPTELTQPRANDPERQVAAALRAFDANAFVVLIDDKQIEALDEPVKIGPETVVTFLRLTSLVGG